MSTDRYDAPWKRILDYFFEPAMAFFFPHIHEAVDWSGEIVSMDKDLEQALHDAEFGLRRVDKLMKVHLLNGETRYLYIHVEVQNQREAEFPKRVFQYYFRLVEKFGEHVVSAVILGDKRPNWRPDTYHKSLLGTELKFQYPVVKLWDYLDNWSELAENPNPFSLVVMAHIKAKQTRNNPGKRFDEKLYLVNEMRRRGFSVKNAMELMRFIGWVLTMPKDLEGQFWKELKQTEKSQKGEIMWHIEKVLKEEGRREGKEEGKREGKRVGREEGRQEGRQEGKKEGEMIEATSLLHRLLNQKFGSVPAWVEEKIGSAEIEQLRNWVVKASLVDNLEEVIS